MSKKVNESSKLKKFVVGLTILAFPVCFVLFSLEVIDHSMSLVTLGILVGLTVIVSIFDYIKVGKQVSEKLTKNNDKDVDND